MTEQVLESWENIDEMCRNLTSVLMSNSTNLTNLSNSTDNDDTLLHFCTSQPSPPPQFVMILIQIFYGLVCLLGLLGNTLGKYCQTLSEEIPNTKH